MTGVYKSSLFTVYTVMHLFVFFLVTIFRAMIVTTVQTCFFVSPIKFTERGIRFMLKTLARETLGWGYVFFYSARRKINEQAIILNFNLL